MSNVLITGASSGIGAQAAAILATQGHAVIGAARNTAAIAEINGVRPVALDLTDEGTISAAVARAGESGPIDVLINCAGYGEFGSVEETALANARAQLEVNVVGAVGVIQAVLPGMRAAGRGRIVNVSSLAAEFAASLGGWYHASKFALEAISDSLRGEVRQFGIDVTLVQPSYVETPWHDVAMDRLARTSSRGLYAPMVAAMRAYFSRSRLAKQTTSVDAVAKLIAKAATVARPKTRYRIGPGANIAVVLARVLPDRTFDAMTRKQFGYA